MSLDAGRFLISLGVRVAPEVVGRMLDGAARQALVEVCHLAQAPLAYPDPGLEVAAWMATQRALSRKGPRAGRRLAQGLVGEDRASEVMDTVDALWEVGVRGEAPPLARDLRRPAPAPAPASPSGDEATREARALADELMTEPPQGVALALALAPRALARRALVDLVDAGRVDVCLWFPCLARHWPSVLEEAGAGEQILGDLLDGMRTEVRDRIMDRIAQADPEVASELRARRFTMRELEELSDDALASVLAHASVEDLALALREAPEVLRRRCLRAMPRGARGQVMSELESSAPVRLRDMEDARHRLGALCRDLGMGAAIGL